MKSSYKKIGDHIRLIDERNTGLRVNQLLGLSISKQFIPSVANIIGTDMENYKIIRKNQFACSTMQVRRDKKMPVALLQEVDEAIISQAYPIFEVKDEQELLPEYLMMWFSRSEFDREACFHAVGGVRGSLEWEDFENLQLPIPHIDKQLEIVKEYNVIQTRIAVNQKMIQKLEETAQAIYKQWFVQFEFPDENGKRYKSNGGEMVWNEELESEIPLGWEVKPIGEVVETLGGGTPSTDEKKYWENGEILWYSPTDVTKSNSIFSSITEKKITKLGLQKSSAKLFPAYSLLMTSRATVGKLTINTKDACTNQGFITLIPNEKISVYLLFDWIKTQLDEISSLATGSTFPEISKSDFRNLKFLNPVDTVSLNYKKSITKLYKTIQFRNEENEKLIELKDLLLSKLATI